MAPKPISKHRRPVTETETETLTGSVKPRNEKLLRVLVNTLNAPTSWPPSQVRK
jgi:hypothetical protein